MIVIVIVMVTIIMIITHHHSKSTSVEESWFLHNLRNCVRVCVNTEVACHNRQ